MTTREPVYLTEDYDDTKDVIVSNYEDGTSGLVLIGVDTNLVSSLVETFIRNRESARRRAAHVRRTEQRRKDRISKAVSLLNSATEWHTSTNECIKVKNMTPRHASRSLNLVMNDFGRWIGDRDLNYEDLGLPFALKDAPIVKALAKRAKVAETKRHRELDEVTDAIFRSARAGGDLRVWETIEQFNKVHSG
jgi:hypothetical protein